MKNKLLSALKWLSLIIVFSGSISWYSQSHFNQNIKKLFINTHQSERVLKAPVQDFSGKEFYLSDLKGKPVLLNFWASWCPSCRASMSELENLQQNFSDKLIVLAINTLEPYEDGMQYVEDNHYSLRFVRSEKLTAIFKVNVLPTKILLDAQRNVIWANTGHVPFLTHQWLERHL